MGQGILDFGIGVDPRYISTLLTATAIYFPSQQESLGREYSRAETRRCLVLYDTLRIIEPRKPELDKPFMAPIASWSLHH